MTPKTSRISLVFAVECGEGGLDRELPAGGPALRLLRRLLQGQRGPRVDAAHRRVDLRHELHLLPGNWKICDIYVCDRCSLEKWTTR